MVTSRRGATKLGCLMSLLLSVTIAYFGVGFGEVYLRSYRFKDAMEQEARFAASRTDEVIVRRLAATADSLGLPEAASRISVRRNGTRVVISATYTEYVVMPFYSRELHFTPTADSNQ
ncbi:MAG: hypothetical protein ABIT38_10770 [Gemmatimonadaceae bacterium]